MKQKICLVENCEKISWVKGLCNNHYYQKLYREGRLCRKPKNKIEVWHFDANLKRTASPDFIRNGTS